ncbi:ribonuclease J [Candidatus Peregrinibacteria bacterium]|nr:ribonuclease J [Candidatus Peregrinibacteria bacterium]
MDKLDEWMNRAFDGSAGTGGDKNSKQAQPGATGAKYFNNKTVNNNQQQSSNPQQRANFSVQSSNKQVHKMQNRNRNFQQSNQGQQGRQQRQKQQFQHNQRPKQPQQHQKAHQFQSQGGVPRDVRGQSNKGRHASQPVGNKPLPKLPKHQSGAKKGPMMMGKIKIIPLGGLNEVGKNMTAFEYEDDIIVVDMGLEFPSEDMFGIDYVVPDVSYLEENKKRIRGIVITHGHLDHIGGIPYILPRLDFPPIFATKLTVGLIKKRIDEFKQDRLAKLNTINPDQPLRLGKFLCNFFRVAHSIPDCVGVIIDTPAGKLVHTGDFKFDATPARNQAPADIHKMEALGSQNVLALFCESTNALKPGHSMSEREVGITLTKIIKEAPARVILASFSSQVGRLQQVIDAAIASNRKVYISGRSMVDTINIAATLGYMDFPKDRVLDIKKYKKVPNEQTLILTTGSQGESVSALSRIAAGEHPHVKVKKGDTIIFSSSPIPGNERAISTVINKLSLLGAEVISDRMMDVHTSGHGKQEELARMINYVKPKYLVPIHGEYYMRLGLARVAKQYCGMKEDQIIMLQNGEVMIAERGKAYRTDEKVETKYILIDGLGEGHIDSQVQMDREIMSQNGALVVLVYIRGKKLGKTPDVVSRGFIYMHESEAITMEISHLAGVAYQRIMDKNPGANRQDIKKYIRQTIDKYTHNKVERRPLIIPLLIEM